MGLFDRKLKQLQNVSEELAGKGNGEAKNFGSIASEMASDIVKDLAGKQFATGKKVIDNVIVFTNASGGAGASTLASNFAYIVSQQGLSVIVVDMNIMCPIQHTFLGIEQEIEKDDLVEALRGSKEISKCIDSSNAVNLLFANNRTLSDEIACNDKIQVENMQLLIKQLRNFYDVVIFDCPMRIDTRLLNTVFYCADSIYCVWDEGIGSIINTERIRRNMALSGIDSYTKMRIILNKRTSIRLSMEPVKKLNLELLGVIPFSLDVVDNSMRGRIYCEKGSATNSNGSDFARQMQTVSEKILKIAGYVFK